MATLSSVEAIFSMVPGISSEIIHHHLQQHGISEYKPSIEAAVREKLEFIYKDTGIKDSLIGRAKTLDRAIEGDVRSVQRNANYMGNVETVHKLELDVYNLRTQLALKGVTKSARVLMSLFNVKSERKGNKTSTTIAMNSQMKLKFEKGEIAVMEEQALAAETMNELIVENERIRKRGEKLVEELKQLKWAYKDVSFACDKRDIEICELKEQLEMAQYNKDQAKLDAENLEMLNDICDAKDLEMNKLNEEIALLRSQMERLKQLNTKKSELMIQQEKLIAAQRRTILAFEDHKKTSTQTIKNLKYKLETERQYSTLMARGFYTNVAEVKQLQCQKAELTSIIKGLAARLNLDVVEEDECEITE